MNILSLKIKNTKQQDKRRSITTVAKNKNKHHSSVKIHHHHNYKESVNHTKNAKVKDESVTSPVNKKNKKDSKIIKELDFQFIINKEMNKEVKNNKEINNKEINKKVENNKEINILHFPPKKNEIVPPTINFVATTPLLSKVQRGELTNIVSNKQLSQNKDTKASNKNKSQTPFLNRKNRKNEINDKNDKNEDSSLKSSSFKNKIKLPAHKKKNNQHINNSLKEKLSFKENLNLLSNKSNFTQKTVNKTLNQTQTSNYKTMEAVKTQLQDSITYMNQNNRKQVVLKLTPEHLGKLEINISMIKKSTKVEIKVQKHETLELLNNNQTSLKNLFSEIKKTSNEISFSFDKNTNSESESNNNKQKRKKYQEIEEKFNYSENKTISSYVGLIEVIV